MNQKILPARLLAALALLLFTSAAHAQSVTVTFTGLVTDQNGAVVPNATVTITNTETGATRRVVLPLSIGTLGRNTVREAN